MSYTRKTLFPMFLVFLLLSFSFPLQKTAASSNGSISFILLSKYSAKADIGKEFHILAITSNGSLPTWKSSNSAIASVNTYGKVTAKKAGTVTLTAKIRNAEASCKVTVNRTIISISKASASIERGEKLKLSASASNSSKIIWKSSKTSVASVDENGNVTGQKPGETVITAAADGSSASCRIKVKSPAVSLSKTRIALYRGRNFQLSASVSSGLMPVWKTNRPSVAVVDETGRVTAVKNGTATITATLDGVSRSCEVTVRRPDISLSSSEITLKKGTTFTLTAEVSSGNLPSWSSSNSYVAKVDSTGKITGVKKGTAYIYCWEDGTKVIAAVHVTD